MIIQIDRCAAGGELARLQVPNFPRPDDLCYDNENAQVDGCRSEGGANTKSSKARWLMLRYRKITSGQWEQLESPIPRRKLRGWHCPRQTSANAMSHVLPDEFTLLKRRSPPEAWLRGQKKNPLAPRKEPGLLCESYTFAYVKNAWSPHLRSTMLQLRI